VALKWEKARKKDQVSKGTDWVPEPAPKRWDEVEDTRTIREKIADGEIGQG